MEKARTSALRILWDVPWLPSRDDRTVVIALSAAFPSPASVRRILVWELDSFLIALR
jgi:hypothetical protein